LSFGRIAAERRPGFPGLRYRSGPACGVAATHPSNPLRGGPAAAYPPMRAVTRINARIAELCAIFGQIFLKILKTLLEKYINIGI
jgi:hypothetical protein